MLLSSQTDFNYDDQTSSSNSQEPPAGEGSSEGGLGRGIRNTISGAVGFIGNLTTRLGGSDSHGNERQNNNWGTRTPTGSYHLSRDDLRDIALSTLRVLDDGEYFPPGQDGPYDLKAKIEWTEENTRYYGPDAGIGGKILESEFIKINEEGGDGGEEEKVEARNKDGNNTAAGEGANDASYLNETKRGENKSEKATAAAASKPYDKANPKDQTRVRATVSQDSRKKATQTEIFIGEYTTLIGARKVHLALAANTDPSANKKIGVLNFASAKKPGGGFFNGSQAQEESITRASTLFPSLITDAASEFYTHHAEDPGNAYYTHAMVYSPGIVLIRDDNGEWRSPVEVDVLTSAAVNAGEIRRDLEREERLRRERAEREERLRKERVEMEYWKRRGEERRKENEKAMAERQQRLRKLEKKKKEKEEIAKLKKEQANLAKLQKEMVKKRETDKGKAKDSGSDKEEPSVEQEKEVVEVENENDKVEEVGVEEPEENQENTADSPDSGLGSGSDSQLKDAEENTESKGTLIQDDMSLPEAPPPKVNQEPTSSSTIVHPLSPSTQPSQASEPYSNLTYTLALEDAETQIQKTMYARISRILHLFQLHQTPRLILGSFGTGVFKNRIDIIASIFADLLIKPGGRFKDVFHTVVFAILGKETVRVFTKVFLTVNKRAKREGTGKMCVFEDKDGSDGDVKEGVEEKTMRIMRWKARRRRNALMDAVPDAAAPFDPAQEDDAAFHPVSFDAAQASGVPSSSAAADAASYPPFFDAVQADAAAYAASSNAAQASVAPCPSFGATQASDISYPTAFTAVQTDAAVQAHHTVADYYGIPEDAKMILTRDDEQVDFVAEATANAPITPSAMDGKDIEMVETKSLTSNKKEDGDIEML